MILLYYVFIGLFGGIMSTDIMAFRDSLMEKVGALIVP
jgi:hypothetical protein